MRLLSFGPWDSGEITLTFLFLWRLSVCRGFTDAIVQLGFDAVSLVVGQHFPTEIDTFVECCQCLNAYAKNKIIDGVAYVRPLSEWQMPRGVPAVADQSLYVMMG